MRMQKTKQVIIALVGIVMCKVGFAGCYPLIPAYYTASLLVEGSGLLTSICMLAGIGSMLSVIHMTKYITVTIVILVAVRLIQWTSRICKSWLAAFIAALVVTAIGIAGSILQYGTGYPLVICGMEGVFVYAATMLFSRILFYFTAQPVYLEEAEPVEVVGSADERLKEYAKSFQGLSAVFSRMNREHRDREMDDVARVEEELTGKLCLSCDCSALCWENNGSVRQNCLRKLLDSIRSIGMPDPVAQTELEQICPYSRDLMSEAVAVFERLRWNQAWYHRLVENREVIAEQLDAMAYVMEDCASDSLDVSREYRKNLKELNYLCKERGVMLHRAKVLQKRENRLQLQLHVSSPKRCVPVKELTTCVEYAMPTVMLPHRDVKTLVGKEETILVYEEETVYKTLQGMARLTRDGENMSGDNFTIMQQESGQVVLGLSDGMGSGHRAYKESEMVIDLVEKFIEAGFDMITAIRMMNSAMVLKGEDDLFSTVDMSLVDLYTGQCDLYKIGAAPTFIKHKDEVECLVSTNLPVGVCHRLEIEHMTKQLAHGEFLVMVTDGVLEYLHVPNPEVTMQEMLESLQVSQPEAMARQILERVLLFTGGKVPDDMTVLVMGIWEK